MVEKAFNKFFWGFFFMLVSFKVQGFDIFPDIVGYIMFAIGFNALSVHSDRFEKAKPFNYIMIFLSVFSIYERPAQAGLMQTSLSNWLVILIGVISTIINLIIVYNLFAGIIEMAKKQRKPDIADEADKKWTQYVIIQFAVLLLFIFMIIPAVAALYMICLVVATIAYAIIVMCFMKKCGLSLND